MIIKTDMCKIYDKSMTLSFYDNCIGVSVWSGPRFCIQMAPAGDSVQFMLGRWINDSSNNSRQCLELGQFDCIDDALFDIFRITYSPCHRDIKGIEE